MTSSGEGTIMQQSKGWRARVGAIVLTSAMVTAGLAVAAGPAQAAPGAVSGATLEWAINTEVQSAPPFGGCNYFSAGESDGTQATYAATAGNVAVVKNGATPTWANHCTLNAGSANQKFVISNGTGTLDPATGATTIQWTGTASVNFYGGLAPFWFENPRLTVAANGTGQITADMGGYATSQENPTVKVPIDPVEDVVIATLNNVNSDNTSGFTVTPKYAGVLYDAAPGNTPQNRTTPGWGSWPDSFVDFQNETGLSSYWYSSGASNDARKPPTALIVDYGTFSTPAVTASPNSNLDPSVQNVITVNGSGYQGAQAFDGVYVGLVATADWTPGQTPNAADFIGAQFVPKQTIINGAFSRAVTVPAGAVTNPSASYIIGTFCAHACAANNRTLDASTPITFRHAPTAPTAVVAKAGPSNPTAGPLVVTYAAPADNGGRPILSYTATCTSTNGGATRTGTRNGAAAAPITVAGTTTAKTYTCRVKATNDAGAGPLSVPSAAVIAGSPAPPTAVVAKSGSATATTGSLVVTYALGAPNGSPIQSKTATCTSSNGGVTRTATHNGAAAASITVGAVTTGKTYTCKVTAKNARGVGQSSVASAPVIVGSPAPPTAINATRPAAGQIRVTYTLGANNGSAIQSKTATCTSSNGGVTRSATHAGATAAPTTVTALTVGKSYTCKVTAKNARGVGLASVASNAVTA